MAGKRIASWQLKFTRDDGTVPECWCCELAERKPGTRYLGEGLVNLLEFIPLESGSATRETWRKVCEAAARAWNLVVLGRDRDPVHAGDLASWMSRELGFPVAVARTAILEMAAIKRERSPDDDRLVGKVEVSARGVIWFREAQATPPIRRRPTGT